MKIEKVTGIVKNIKPYGAFVEIGGGVVGLVHIEDLSVARIKTPYERVKIGQEINTKAQKEKTSVYENIVSEIKTPFYDNDIPTTKVEVVKQVVEQKAGIVSLSKKDFEASTYNTQKNLDSKILPRLNAIVGVLDKFNLLENLSENQKNELIKALIKIISYKE